MNSVECYNVEKDEWIALDGLPRCRAGCVGFLAGREKKSSFGLWVDMRWSNLRIEKWWIWREIGDMWGEWERRKLEMWLLWMVVKIGICQWF
ncbi:hypothetical protein C5167_038013 [Papaver somniferum]|uniref:Uncharacterized protein n=1 Tax=Papaver somniferum TaxID=3469 RepID=A0A4Y7IBP4_PAPSO|nr:hypothetical protein C5167_038013 [Papaver somniferum]